ncbi:MAG: ABC transporter ATP-binding protein [Actinomycetes bacterium]
MISVSHLSKSFGSLRAVDDLTFSVAAGTVTGFLGPNGAGKTTTLRMVLGLVTPTEGTATIAGRPYADLADPIRTVGAALEASSFHPGRTGRDHLRAMARAGGLPDRRADEVLELVGLTDPGARRVGTYSSGMRQRLGLAGALLGDPAVLVLDEPANGLDPEGIAWLRGFLRHRAAQGGTVLVSSHVLAEVEQTVDDVVILARGRLVRACPLAELVAGRGAHVVVRTPQSTALRAALAAGVDGVVPSGVRDRPDGALEVLGVAAAVVGRAALRSGAELHELREERTDLEDIFLALTRDDPDGAP